MSQTKYYILTFFLLFTYASIAQSNDIEDIDVLNLRIENTIIQSDFDPGGGVAGIHGAVPRRDLTLEGREAPAFPSGRRSTEALRSRNRYFRVSSNEDRVESPPAMVIDDFLTQKRRVFRKPGQLFFCAIQKSNASTRWSIESWVLRCLCGSASPRLCVNFRSLQGYAGRGRAS